MRGVLGSGKRDVREMEILGITFRWKEEELEAEASDKHSQTLLEGLGLSEESKTVSGSQAGGDRTRRRRGHAGGNGEDEVRELGGDAELHEPGHVGRAISREGDMHEDGEADTRKLEKIEEGMQMHEGVEKVRWVMRAWKNNGVTVDAWEARIIGGYLLFIKDDTCEVKAKTREKSFEGVGLRQRGSGHLHAGVQAEEPTTGLGWTSCCRNVARIRRTRHMRLSRIHSRS